LAPLHFYLQRRSRPGLGAAHNRPRMRQLLAGTQLGGLPLVLVGPAVTVGDGLLRSVGQPDHGPGSVEDARDLLALGDLDASGLPALLAPFAEERLGLLLHLPREVAPVRRLGHIARPSWLQQGIEGTSEQTALGLVAPGGVVGGRRDVRQAARPEQQAANRR